MGVWRRLEDRLLALQADRPRLARYMQVAWFISNAVLVIGIVVIFLMAAGVWRP